MPNNDSIYRVKHIKGKVDGVKIYALLAAGTGIPGNVDPITGTPYLGDNKLLSKSFNGSKAQLTGSGIIILAERRQLFQSILRKLSAPAELLEIPHCDSLSRWAGAAQHTIVHQFRSLDQRSRLKG